MEALLKAALTLLCLSLSALSWAGPATVPSAIAQSKPKVPGLEEPEGKRKPRPPPDSRSQRCTTDCQRSMVRCIDRCGQEDAECATRCGQALTSCSERC